MDLFNLDRAFARSHSTVRTLPAGTIGGQFTQIMGQNDKRIAFCIAAALGSSTRFKVYLTPDQSMNGIVNVESGFLLGHDFITNPQAFSGPITGTMVGSLDSFAVTLAATLTSAVLAALPYEFNCSLRMHGDMVRMPWFAECLDTPPSLTIVETFMDDSCLLDSSDSPYPGR